MRETTGRYCTQRSVRSAPPGCTRCVAHGSQEKTNSFEAKRAAIRAAPRAPQLAPYLQTGETARADCAAAAGGRGVRIVLEHSREAPRRVLRAAVSIDNLGCSPARYVQGCRVPFNSLLIYTASNAFSAPLKPPCASSLYKMGERRAGALAPGSSPLLPALRPAVVAALFG